MARGRARGRGKSSTRGITGRKNVRSSAPGEGLLPGVYYDMLDDATASSSTRASEDGRTIKKRRVRGHMVTQGQEEDTTPKDALSDEARNMKVDAKRLSPPNSMQQTAYNSSEDSEDSDMAWEEVDLKSMEKTEDSAANDNDSDSNENLNLILGESASTPKRQSAKRRPVSAAQRKLRLEIHKMHVLSLLVHIHLRNHWCNDNQVQSSLERLLSKRTISYLNPGKELSQFQKSRSFMDGLAQARDAFKREFKITARGMSRSYWAEDVEALADQNLPEDIDLPTEKSDFRDIAMKLKGSRDLGAQLFCALLRTAGAEARLVCSLQPLPFTATTKGIAPQKPISKPIRVVANPESLTATSDDESTPDAGSDTSTPISGLISSTGTPWQVRSKLAARLGRAPPVAVHSTVTSTPIPPKKPMKKQIRESPYPVYWVESFNTAVQKWIPIDPLVTNTIGKPTKFEPPINDCENSLTYVVAFEEDGSARDVTRRYTKAYNAKTRRNRVEITKGGDRWWRSVMRMYKGTHDLDCDQVEDAELAAKEAAEEMPKNIQDFKGHPYYALERHLKRNEVIHPKRKVGSVSSGKVDKNKNLDPVYRRRDVHIVKSTDGWYRLGREIKTGEQPLKRVQSRRKRETLSEEEGSSDGENAGTGMYAAFQTIAYQAPPVVNGRVPKNVYGNLDIYVPSMVPEGGVHISNPETAKAAKILGIDYSDAVTGFEFKGRHGTAVIKGAVIAVQYQEAVEQVLQGFYDERAGAEETRRSLEALRTWKRFYTGLKIKERIQGYKMEGEMDDVGEELDEVGDEDDDAFGGGFMPSADEPVAEPTIARFARRSSENNFYDSGGGFLSDDRDLSGGYQPDDEDLSGGFLPETEETNEISVLGKQAQISYDRDDAGSGGFETEVDNEIFKPNQSIHDDTFKREAESIDLVRNRLGSHEDNGRALLRMIDSVQPLELGEGLDTQKDPPKRKQPIITGQVQSTVTHRDPKFGSIEDDNKNKSQKEQSPDLVPPPVLSPKELEEAMMLQQIYQTENLPEFNDENRPELGSTVQTIPEPRDVTSLEIPKPATLTQESEDDDFDKGSLLSHDPSDEDADPDWLL